MFVVIATVTARPDRRDDLVALLQKLAPASRGEQGCVSYRFAADVEDPDAFTSVEVWSDRAALETHLGSPELAAVLGDLGDLVAGPPSITGYAVDGAPVAFA